MADETETAAAPAVSDAPAAAPAADETPAVLVTMADLAASVGPKVAPPAPAGSGRFAVTLEEFCTAHSKVRRGEVELLGAFYFVMKADGKAAPATEEAFLAEFASFTKTHKPI